MKIDHQWRRLYRRYEEGMMSNALICYGEFPHTRHAKLGVTQFQRVLILDLWIIQLKITWFTKLREDENEKPPKMPFRLA